ncbi:LYR motif-containing protein 4 [Sitodiplosis mosellana]|uniref:LYR motif-containing protein 4 n=1 Tax=Sitodiplosis mosellana TaxID=263140 RepID=UPI002443F938|nr:LYR motif-containing protein 4 [Sitodiplosis mosellana]
MAGSVSKGQVLSIYKQLLRESQKFNSYNFRNYALRRIRDAFKDNKSLSQAQEVQKQYQFANENLDIIKRQTIIGKLYSSDRLCIEKQSANE